MKLIQDSLSVIAVGGWNTQIFSPDWLKNNLCDDPECEIEIAVPVNNPAALPRLSFEDIHVFLNPSRLELKPQSQTIEQFSKCLDILKKTLETLKHTPVTSFGINFAFVSNEDHDEVIQKFLLTDNGLFDSEKNTLKKTVIQRAFEQQDGSVLNLAVSIEDENVVISFNYHNDVNNAESCVEKLVDDLISSYYTNSVSILEDVYGVSVEIE